MFAQNRELARLALHRCMPHVGCANWNDEIQPVVTLKDGKLPCVIGDRCRHARIASLQLWFECGVQMELRARPGKELSNPPQVTKLDLRGNLS
jgi:hypothetical protein